VITPKVADCTNLLVTFGVSATHFVFSMLRVEPTHMAIGEAAGVAAALAVDQDIDVANVDYPTLRSILLNSGSAVPSMLPQVN